MISTFIDFLGPVGGSLGVGGGIWTLIKSQQNEESIKKQDKKLEKLADEHHSHEVHVAKNYTSNEKFERLENKIDDLKDILIKIRNDI